MKRKYLIILLSFIFVLLIILGHYIFVSITYVPRADTHGKQYRRKLY